MLNSNMLIVSFFLPFLMALMLIFGTKIHSIKKKLHTYILIIGLITMIVLFFLLLSMFTSIREGIILQKKVFQGMLPFELSFQADGLSFTIGFVAFLLWSAVYIYSIVDIKKDIVKYYFLLLLLLGSILGTILAKNLMSFYFFLEISGIVTYFLIIHKKNEISLRAGYKYIIMTLIGAFLIFLSILFVYEETKSYEMNAVMQCRSPMVPILFLIGCLIRAGAVPVHTWLPDAHPAAPSPISAFLSGIMIKIGIYGILRIILPGFNYTTGVNASINILNNFIFFTGIVSMLSGVILALMQSDVKRLLAYHSISQLGYILFGIGVGSILGISGGIYHMINHAFFKGLLFLCMGAVIHRTGEKRLGHLGALWRKMPITTITCLVAAMAISGVPPFNGFASKVILGNSVHHSSIFYTWILNVTSALTFVSFFKLVKYTFFGKNKNLVKNIKEVPVFMNIPMAILSIFCLILGLSSKLLLNEIIFPAIAPSSVLTMPEISLWNLETFLNAFWRIISGFAIFYFFSRFGIISKEEKEIKVNYKAVKMLQFVSINSIYENSAMLFNQLSKKMNQIHSRELNTHLIWVTIALFILIFVLFLNIS